MTGLICPEQLPLRLSAIYDSRSSSTFLWYVIENNPEKRTRAIDTLKEGLTEHLTRDLDASNITGFRFEDVVLPQNPRMSDIEQVVRQLSSRRGYWHIPVFADADALPNLGQTFFDLSLPGIIGVSEKGYLNQKNPSKRECINSLSSSYR